MHVDVMSLIIVSNSETTITQADRWRKMKKYHWIIFLVLGVLILLFAAYNAFYIPALDPADPDQGGSGKVPARV